jgi:hypothetical protein
MYPGSIALGGNGEMPLAQGSITLGVIVGTSSMVVSVIPDKRLMFIGSIMEGAAPRDWPTVESVGLRVGNDSGGTEDMVLVCIASVLKIYKRFLARA